MVNDRLDELLKESEKRKKTKDVQMSLDYVPSWITGAKTLLEKINRCVEKVDGKQDELSNTQLSAVNSGITQAKVEHYDAIPIVVGNPTESGSVNLTEIKIGDTVYNIPSGGGSELYEHIISLNVSSNFSLKLIVLSNRGTQYNLNDLQGLMEISNFVRGEFTNDVYDHVYVITGLITPKTPTGDFNVSYLGAYNLYELSYMAMNENSNIYDDVIQL